MPTSQNNCHQGATRRTMADSDNSDQDLVFTDETVVPSVEELNKKLGAKDLNIVLINVRSLNKNFNNLEIFIDRFAQKPDVIVCTETWLLHDYKFFQLPDFNTYYNNSTINKADGVLIYINKNIDESTKTEKYGSIKFLSSIIKLNEGKKIKLTAVYRCHDINKNVFIDNLNNYILNNKKYQNHLILGDFNINLFDKDESTDNYLNNFLESCYKPLFLDVTRMNTVDCGKDSSIDNIFIKSDDSVIIKAYKIENSFTDHYPLIVSLKIDKQEIKVNKSYQIIQFRKLNKVAASTNWNTILEESDPNKACKLLIDKIKSAIIDCSKTIKKKKKCANE